MDQQFDDYKRSFDGLSEKVKKGFLPGANGGLKALMLLLFAYVLFQAGIRLAGDLKYASFLVSNFGSFDEGGTGDSLTILGHAFLQVLFSPFVHHRSCIDGIEEKGRMGIAFVFRSGSNTLATNFFGLPVQGIILCS